MTFYRNIRESVLITVLVLPCVVLFHSCTEAEDGGYSPNGDNSIVFYIDSGLDAEMYSKAVIEDTDYLLDNALPIHVYNAVPSTQPFGDIEYQGNGLWYDSSMQWEDKEYLFYAYIESSVTGNGGAVSSPPTQVTMVQPGSYSETADWADYLLSYRVSAHGAEKAPVRLQFERITTAVEFYMAGGSLDKIVLKEVTFSNVCRKATFQISRHGTPDDATGQFGMRNLWNVALDESDGNYVDYTWSGLKDLLPFEGESSRYDSKYRCMNFMTVYQPVSRDGLVKHLTVKYEVNGVENTAEFDLSESGPSEWQPGHRVRYSMTIDSEIHLQGIIEDWKEVGFIESTFLPGND